MVNGEKEQGGIFCKLHFSSCTILFTNFVQFLGGVVGRKLIVIYIQITLKVICKQMNILYSDKT